MAIIKRKKIHGAIVVLPICYVLTVTVSIGVISVFDTFGRLFRLVRPKNDATPFFTFRVASKRIIVTIVVVIYLVNHNLLTRPTRTIPKNT